MQIVLIMMIIPLLYADWSPIPQGTREPAAQAATEETVTLVLLDDDGPAENANVVFEQTYPKWMQRQLIDYCAQHNQTVDETVCDLIDDATNEPID